MRQIKVETINGKIEENIYEIKELPFIGKLLKSSTSKKRGVTYIEIPCAFDIETTNIYKKDAAGKILKEPRPYAFMYQWQFCLEDCVCFGRTWKEFRLLLSALEENMNLSDSNRLVIWVHNLPFEFTFMKEFIDIKEGFFTDERKPLRILTTGGIEFRCSYQLSNMTLAKFCENEEHVIHYKLDGDNYNYDKVRLPTTPLTEYEESYCYNDVRGLCECIRARLKHDTLASIPMTSTGYVRRDLRKSVTSNKKNRTIFQNIALDKELYTMCRGAFRGGNTHANLYRSNQIIKNAWGYDITSSYPYSMLLPYYPMTKFEQVTMGTFKRFFEDNSHAMLMKVRFKNIRYIPTCGVPYIAISKLEKHTSKLVNDNGRLLYDEFIEMTITDIDLRIILKDYSIEDLSIDKVYVSEYDYLPKEVRSTMMDYYKSKTLLKGVTGSEYEYVKSKNKLNSTYGCMVMRIDHPLITYDSDLMKYDSEVLNIDEALEKYYKSRNNFLSYQHGVFITALSRLHLQEMLWKVGKDVIYCDTDSIKGVGDHSKIFEDKNKEIIEQMKKEGGYAYDKNGNIHYLGVWDNETENAPYEEFKTLGAKKYVYKQDGKIKSTIAGVNKKIGAEYFTKYGIDSFKIGTKITDSGHLTAYYNDEEIHTITIDGVEIETASNLALINNSYKIGVTDDYLELLEKSAQNILECEYLI